MRLRLVWRRGRRLPLESVAYALLGLTFIGLGLALFAVLAVPRHETGDQGHTVDIVYFEGKVGREYFVTEYPSALDSLEAGAKRMESRRNTLNEACAALPEPPHIAPKEFLISERPAFVFCPVHRAASASWLANMLRFQGARWPRPCGRAGTKPSSPPMKMMRKYFPQPTASQLTRALAVSPSLLIVRHPLDRILSAFRDGDFDGQDFPTFAAQLVNMSTSGVQFTDPRWIPIHNFCSPCAAEFSYIAKVETLAADQRYLLLAEPTLSDAGASAQWCHPNRRGLPTTHEFSAKYYTSLPVNLVRALGAIYAQDMRLFGYSLHGYLATTRT